VNHWLNGTTSVSRWSLKNNRLVDFTENLLIPIFTDDSVDKTDYFDVFPSHLSLLHTLIDQLNLNSVNYFFSNQTIVKESIFEVMVNNSLNSIYEFTDHLFDSETALFALYDHYSQFLTEHLQEVVLR
jgi:hypothetical protein